MTISRPLSATTFASRLALALAFVVLATLLGSGQAIAQTDSATLDVLVDATDGSPLPGVTVTVNNTGTGATRITVTDALGLARIALLPPGEYRMNAQLEGFQAVQQEGLVLRLGQTARIEVQMSPEASGSIVVTGEAPLVDVFRTDTSTNIVPEQIEELPVAERDPLKLAFLAPGVSRERGAFRFISGGPVIGAGGNASQSSIFVDGVDFTDQALGLARARFSQDAIREFRVVNNRYDTEMGGTAGGGLSIVTRSGTNRTKGSVFGFWRDDSLRSTGELETDEVDYSRYQVGATVGGALVADRTHYFASVEQISEDDIAPVRPLGAFAGQARDAENPTDQTLGLLSLTHQFSDATTGTAKLVYDRYREENFRVGGVSDESNGQDLDRDNWNLTLGHTWVVGDGGSLLNEARFQTGVRDYFEPTNSNAPQEWFSNGNTLRTGTNTVGDLLGEGDYFELRDTVYLGRDRHEMKLGASWFHVEERSIIDTFDNGLFIYAGDNRALPILYLFGEGSSDVEIETDIFSAFVQNDWRVRDDLTVAFGLRYDYDTDGANPDFEHPLVGDRSTDSDNIQPRVSFSWDVSGDGSGVLRGGAGYFTGRYLLLPAFTELQQNGITGRVTRTNLNGLLLGLPPAFWLDPANPETSGVALSPDITLLADDLEAPESIQLSLGYSQRLGSTGLYGSIEGVYAEGDNEIVIRDTNFGGNANPVRLDPTYNQINTYTNDGRSEYSALILSVNGTLAGGHLITSSVTFADKENIADDFSPAFPTGYPSDPANIEAEFGPSRGQEDVRVVLSGVFRLPFDLTVAPIFEYGSGQPWTRLLGFDANGDGKNSDRAPGVGRNGEDGPDFRSFNLRLTKSLFFGGRGTDGRSIDLIVEGFNLFDSTNFDVTSVVANEFLAAGVANPDFGSYRATLAPREIQLGVRLRY